MSIASPRDKASANSSENAEINRNMSVPQIISILLHHGVPDITQQLDSQKTSVYPVSGGLFSDTYRGALGDGTPVAIKCLRPFVASGHKQLTIMARELYNWSKLQHPNVLELFGAAASQDRLSVVSRWMGNGILPRYIDKNPQVDRVQLCMQVATGLAYLHQSGLVHGELQGSNILVSELGVPKLTNFTRVKWDENKPSLDFSSSNPSGGSSLRWAAPELLMGGSITKASDIYALGMTFLEIMTGKIPFAGQTDFDVILILTVRWKHPEPPEELSRLGEKEADLLWTTMSRCWAFEPEARPEATSVVDAVSQDESGQS